jgi:hypothetical protein
VEAALVAVAFVLAIGLMARGLRDDRPEAPALLSTYPPASPYVRASMATPALARMATPALATVVPGQPPLRIFSCRTAEVVRGLPPAGQSGADYRLTLARGAGGRWSSVLRAPETPPEGGGALTVTLVVPWTELGSRYSAVNLVVR